MDATPSVLDRYTRRYPIVRPPRAHSTRVRHVSESVETSLNCFSAAELTFTEPLVTATLIGSHASICRPWAIRRSTSGHCSASAGGSMNSSSANQMVVTTRPCLSPMASLRLWCRPRSPRWHHHGARRGVPPGTWETPTRSEAACRTKPGWMCVSKPDLARLREQGAGKRQQAYSFGGHSDAEHVSVPHHPGLRLAKSVV